MSYNQRDDQGLFGPLAGVEIPNGAGQSLIVAHQLSEPSGLFGLAAATFVSQATTAGTSYTIFMAPPQASATTSQLPQGQSYRIIGASVFYTTAAAGAAQMFVEICPAGTANGSGNNAIQQSSNPYYLLNTALTTANTPNQILLASNIDNTIILPGGRINVYVTTVATTGLVNFTLVVNVARIS
jgi:hypothetical protein